MASPVLTKALPRAGTVLSSALWERNKEGQSGLSVASPRVIAVRTSRGHSLLRVRFPSLGAGRFERDAGRGKRRWTWWWQVRACRAWLGWSRRQLQVTVNASCSFRAGPDGEEKRRGRRRPTFARVETRLGQGPRPGNLKAPFARYRETCSLIRFATRPRLRNSRALAPPPLRPTRRSSIGFVFVTQLHDGQNGQHGPRTRQTFSRLGLKSSEGPAPARIERRLYRL